MLQLDFETALEEERRKKENENYVWRQPVRPVSLMQWCQRRQMNYAEQQSSEDEGNRIRDSNTLCYHRNYGRGDQQPYEELNGGICSHLSMARRPTKAPLTSGRKR